MMQESLVTSGAALQSDAAEGCRFVSGACGQSLCAGVWASAGTPALFRVTQYAKLCLKRDLLNICKNVMYFMLLGRFSFVNHVTVVQPSRYAIISLAG